MALPEPTKLNFWVPEAVKIPVLLGGYWGDYPALEDALVILSITQIVLGLGFFAYILIYAFNKNILNDDWVIELLPNKFSLSFYLIVPLLTCAWEIFLGGLHLGLVYAWYSAPSMAMGYLHSQIEWYLVYVRTTMLFHNDEDHDSCCCGPKGRKNYLLFSGFLTFTTLFIFMSTSNPIIQAGVAGVAFLTDFVLLFITPILACKFNEIKENLSHAAIRSEIFSTALSLIHIIQYYPPLFIVIAHNSPETRQLSGIWLTSVGYINLIVFLIYGIYVILALDNAPRKYQPLPQTS